MARQPDKHSSRSHSAAEGFKAAAGALKEAGLQADTFVRSAANTATFGLADNAEAAADAAFGGGGSGDWAHRYQNELNQQKQRDVYDSIHRGVAKRLGEIGGVGLDFLGGAEGGVAWSEGLPSVAKGKLGEALSVGKTLLKRDVPVKYQAVKRLARSYTRADHLTADGTYVEAKFGPKASLSNAQTRAQTELGPQYRVDWWLPKHVGYIGGGAAGGGALLQPKHNEPPHRVQPLLSGGRP